MNVPPVESLAAGNVPEDLADDLRRRLTMGDRGEMAAVFRACRDPSRRGWEGRCFIASGPAGLPIGWALRWRAFTGNAWTVHVFVDPSHRRNGVGAALVAAASRRLRHPVRRIAWDDRSRAFWATVDARTRRAGTTAA